MNVSWRKGSVRRETVLLLENISKKVCKIKCEDKEKGSSHWRKGKDHFRIHEGMA